MNADLAIIDKRRDAPGISNAMNVIGSVEGKKCIIVDDLVDSGGTICNAAKALLEEGLLVFTVIAHMEFIQVKPLITLMIQL